MWMQGVAGVSIALDDEYLPANFWVGFAGGARELRCKRFAVLLVRVVLLPVVALGLLGMPIEFRDRRDK
jgi:hypothetical protein